MDRFKKYKDDYKLSNIIYGIKAIEKMAYVFHPDNKSSRNKWIKSMKHKSDNCVYFIYNHKKKGKSHRFLAPNSDLGESLSSKGNTIKKRKNKKSQKKTQKGGFCPPCFFAPAAFAGAAIGGAATFMKSTRSSSQYSNINGKKRSSQKDILKENINGIKTERDISRKGRIITVNGKKIKKRDVKTAKLLYKKLREKYMKESKVWDYDSV